MTILICSFKRKTPRLHSIAAGRLPIKAGVRNDGRKPDSFKIEKSGTAAGLSEIRTEQLLSRVI